jgi:hypothetical protein
MAEKLIRESVYRDNIIGDFVSQYEYTMVFPMKKTETNQKEQTKFARYCMDAMLKQGLELFT